MKIKKLIKMLECIEGEYYAYGHSGRLPSDMYELGYYTSSDENGADTDINMEDMDFVHFVRAFKKMQKTLAEEVRRDTQEGKVAELEQEVAHLKQQLYGDTSPHPRYVFSEIPRNMYGDAFVDALKQYLNKKRYSLKVRGQHVKDEYKGTGATDYGQNIQQSTHLRVYIEEK